MLAGMYIVYIIVRCKMQPELAPPRQPKTRCPLREKLRLLKELILPGLVAFSVLGSLYLGWATPTEAAGVGVSARCSPCSHGTASSLAGVRHAIGRHDQGDRDAVLAVLRLVGADRRLHARRRHQADPGHDDGLPLGPIGIVIMIQIIWIILGCFIDWIGILLLTAPIFVPVAVEAGLRSRSGSAYCSA